MCRKNKYFTRRASKKKLNEKLNEEIKTEKKYNDEKTKEILSIKNVLRECEELQKKTETENFKAEETIKIKMKEIETQQKIIELMEEKVDKGTQNISNTIQTDSFHQHIPKNLDGLPKIQNYEQDKIHNQTEVCINEFLHRRNKCKYGKRCRFSRDIDFRKLGICKFDLKKQGSCRNGKNCKWSHQTPEKLRKNEDFLYKHSINKLNHSKDQFEEWPEFDQYRSRDIQKEYFLENPNIDQKK